MDRPGDELLAGPRFAAHQHARIARGHPGNEPAHSAEPRRTADETRCSLCPSHPPLERPEPERQLAFLPHPFQHGLDLGKLARLGEVVEHPLTNGRHGRLQRRLPGDDHRLGVRGHVTDTGDDLHPSDTGHVEINDHAVIGGAVEGRDRRPTIRTDRRLVPQARQFDPHQFLERHLVVGKQDPHRPGRFCHVTSPGLVFTQRAGLDPDLLSPRSPGAAAPRYRPRGGA